MNPEDLGESSKLALQKAMSAAEEDIGLAAIE